MASIPWPSDDPQSWEYLFLGGVVFPGLAFVKVSGGQKIDRKDAPGSDGESTTLQGEKAKDVDITIRMWESSQWDEWEDAFAVIEPPLKKRGPLDIVTSATASRLITSIVIEKIDGPDWNAKDRWMEYKLKAIEHKPSPPKSATKKNTSSAQTSDQWMQVPPNGSKSKRAIEGDADGVVLTKARRSAQQA